MSISTRTRVLAVTGVALVAGGVAFARAAAIEPHIEVDVRALKAPPGQPIYEVTVRPRGGETVERLRIDALVGTMQVGPPRETSDLPPGGQFKTRVMANTANGLPPTVRVVQDGTVHIVRDVDLGAEAR